MFHCCNFKETEGVLLGGAVNLLWVKLILSKHNYLNVLIYIRLGDFMGVSDQKPRHRNLLQTESLAVCFCALGDGVASKIIGNDELVRLSPCFL